MLPNQSDDVLLRPAFDGMKDRAIAHPVVSIGLAI